MRTVEERFWEKVDCVSSPNGCFILGSHQDNVTDRNNKGRQAKGEALSKAMKNKNRIWKGLPGENNGSSVLNLIQVSELKTLYATGNFSQRVLGRKFGICQPQVSRIINNKRWNKGV